ncbi:hypothetical protein CDAR_494941 [Caerostris darwini]|uniref:Uncharacterized protein n=1 Tax=Caerostris darwini TaxID=1538125 RepID=A0AAV4RYC4_9ARAC|nr:hypothetical protein CDAR_494941 [Caerostris darwini]
MTVLRTGKNALCDEGMSFRGGGPLSERNGVSGKYDQNIDYPKWSRHVRRPCFLFLESQAQVRLPERVSKPKPQVRKGRISREPSMWLLNLERAKSPPDKLLDRAERLPRGY